MHQIYLEFDLIQCSSWVWKRSNWICHILNHSCSMCEFMDLFCILKVKKILKKNIGWIIASGDWPLQQIMVYLTKTFGENRPKVTFANLTNQSYQTSQFWYVQIDCVFLTKVFLLLKLSWVETESTIFYTLMPKIIIINFPYLPTS